MTASLDDVQLKALVTETLLEVFKGQGEEFAGLLLEVLKDLALSRANEEGQGSGLVDKEEILNLIAGRA
jgi:hypothetical protein